MLKVSLASSKLNVGRPSSRMADVYQVRLLAIHGHRNSALQQNYVSIKKTSLQADFCESAGVVGVAGMLARTRVQ